jgi:nitrogen fixation/metabolism regulation signal transduction histidine kinase
MIARIVRTFLAMARRRPPEVTAIDLNAIVEATLRLVAYNPRTTDIELDLARRRSTDLDGGFGPTQQVVANLLVGAQQR